MKEILDQEKQSTGPVIKVKHIITGFIVGLLLIVTGVLIKIIGWHYASALIMLGYLFNVISIVLALIRLLFVKNLNSFFNK